MMCKPHRLGRSLDHLHKWLMPHCLSTRQLSPSSAMGYSHLYRQSNLLPCAPKYMRFKYESELILAFKLLVLTRAEWEAGQIITAEKCRESNGEPK